MQSRKTQFKIDTFEFCARRWTKAWASIVKSARRVLCPGIWSVTLTGRPEQAGLRIFRPCMSSLTVSRKRCMFAPAASVPARLPELDRNLFFSCLSRQVFFMGFCMYMIIVQTDIQQVLLSMFETTYIRILAATEAFNDSAFPDIGSL